MMCRTYQKLTSLIVLIAFSVLFVPGQGYAAAPTIKQVFVNPAQTEITVGSDPIALTVQAVGAGLAYKWEITGPGKIEGTGESVFYVAPNALERDSMQAIITVTVTNTEGQEATKTVTFTILDPSPQEPVSGPGEPVSSDDADSSGMSTTTKVALGVGAAAALGGVIALAAGGGGDSGDKGGPFTGTFRWDYTGQTTAGNPTSNMEIYTLQQKGNIITGTLEITSNLPGWCSVNFTVPVNGTANGLSAVITDAPGGSSCQNSSGGTYRYDYPGYTYSVMLINNNNTLRFEGGAEFGRIAKIMGAETEDTVIYGIPGIKGDFMRQ